MRPARWPGYLAALLSTVFWGGAFVAGKALLAEVTPVGVLALRYGISAIGFVLLLAVACRGRPVRPRVGRRRLLLVALFGQALNAGAVTPAIAIVGAGAASLVIAMVPVLTGLLAVLAGQERFEARKLQGLAVALAGLAIVVLLGGPEASLSAGHLLGLVGLLLGALGFAIYNVYSRPLFRHYAPIEVSSYLGLLATLWLATLLVAPPLRAELALIAELSAGGWAAALWLGVLSNVAAFLCWFWALRRLESTRVALFSYLIPVWSVAGAAVLLQERVTWWFPLGVALVAAGIVVGTRQPRSNVLSQERGRCDGTE